MAISEIKMQIVIDNYFKSECDTDTSIRQAFEKGFRIGVEKGTSVNSPLFEIDLVRCGECKWKDECILGSYGVSEQGFCYKGETDEL